jgi:hypothetical protein
MSIVAFFLCDSLSNFTRGKNEYCILTKKEKEVFFPFMLFF